MAKIKEDIRSFAIRTVETFVKSAGTVPVRKSILTHLLLLDTENHKEIVIEMKDRKGAILAALNRRS